MAVDTDEAARPWVAEEYRGCRGVAARDLPRARTPPRAACIASTATRSVVGRIRKRRPTLNPAVDWHSNSSIAAMPLSHWTPVVSARRWPWIWAATSGWPERRRTSSACSKSSRATLPTGAGNEPTKLIEVDCRQLQILRARIRVGSPTAGRPDGDRWRRRRIIPVLARAVYSASKSAGKSRSSRIPRRRRRWSWRGSVWKLARRRTVAKRNVAAKAASTVDSRNWVLVTTTSLGDCSRARFPGTRQSFTPVINHINQGSPASTGGAAVSCGPTALYATRSSVKTRAIYVSDRRGCRLLSLKSNIDTHH